MSQYQFTASSNADIDAIWESIAQDNSEAADRTIAAIYQHVLLLADFPEIGHSRVDLASQRPILFSPVGNYMVIYRSDYKPVLIIGILHAARDIPSILRHRKTTQ